MNESDAQTVLGKVLGLSDEQVDTAETRDQLFARAAAANPQLALVARLLANRPVTEGLDHRDTPVVEAGISDSQKLEVQELRGRVARLEEVVRIFRVRNNALAEALGAC